MKVDELGARMQELLEEIERLDEPVRGRVFELLDCVDALHRPGLQRLAEALTPSELERLRREPAVAWLLHAYGIGSDDREAAEAAIDGVRPYIDSHGGKVEVLRASGGIVRVALSGSCSGCTASAVTLKHGIEAALEERMPGFVALEVEEREAPAHPPPGPTLLQIETL